MDNRIFEVDDLIVKSEDIQAGSITVLALYYSEQENKEDYYFAMFTVTDSSIVYDDKHTCRENINLSRFNPKKYASQRFIEKMINELHQQGKLKIESLY